MRFIGHSIPLFCKAFTIFRKKHFYQKRSQFILLISYYILKYYNARFRAWLTTTLVKILYVYHRDRTRERWRAAATENIVFIMIRYYIILTVCWFKMILFKCARRTVHAARAHVAAVVVARARRGWRLGGRNTYATAASFELVCIILVEKP